MKKIFIIFAVLFTILFSVSCYAAYGTVVNGSAVVPLESFKELGFGGYYESNNIDDIDYVLVYQNSNYGYVIHFSNDNRESGRAFQNVYVLNSNGNMDEHISLMTIKNIPVSYINGKAYVSARGIYSALTLTIADCQKYMNMSWDANNKMVHYSFKDKDIYIPCTDISKLTGGENAGNTYYIDTSDNNATISHLEIYNRYAAKNALAANISEGSGSSANNANSSNNKSGVSSNNNLGIDDARFEEIEDVFESYVDRISKCRNNDEAIAISDEITERRSDYEEYYNNPLNSAEKEFVENAMLITSYIAICKGADIVADTAADLTNRTIEGEKSFDIAVEMGRMIFDASDINFVKQVQSELYNSVNSMISGFQSAVR